MNRDELETGPVTAAEADAARCLADAVAGGDGVGADAEAVAVVRLLASLREMPRDEVAARRGSARAASALRAEARKRLAVRILAPLAAALVLAAGLSGRRAVSPAATEVTLAEREAQARAAAREARHRPVRFPVGPRQVAPREALGEALRQLSPRARVPPRGERCPEPRSQRNTFRRSNVRRVRALVILSAAVAVVAAALFAPAVSAQGLGPQGPPPHGGAPPEGDRSGPHPTVSLWRWRFAPSTKRRPSSSSKGKRTPPSWR